MLESKLRKCAYAMADKHLKELPSDAILAHCPKHYGTEVTDEHKLFLWNGLVDHYQELPDTELYSLYQRHVLANEPIIKALIFEPLEPEMEQLIDEITDLIWNGNRLLINENED